MSKSNNVPKYVQPQRNDKGRLIARGVLKHGLKIGEDVHREFEMQEPKTGDLFAAEQEAPLKNVLTFNASLMVLQLVRVGGFQGPFTLGMIGTLRPVDFNILREAQQELDELGEAD